MNIQIQKLELVELILGINNAKALKELKIAAQKAANATVSETSTTTKKKYKDETEYLLSTQANRENLLESIAQGKRGEKTVIKLEDLWK